MFKKISYIITTICLILASCLRYSPSSLASQACDDLKIVFARGSGEALHAQSETAWRTNLADYLDKTTLKYEFYELGSHSQAGHQYPAVTVSDSAAGFMNLVGAYVSAGSAFRFGQSVTEGRRELLAYVQQVSARCPNTKFVLGGYSQGAMLITGILDQLRSDQIIYVATFGDPKLYLPEGKGIIPDACIGQNLSNYRVNVSDCRAYEGILGSYRPYQTEAYKNKIGAWCNNRDIMCSSGISINDHTSYVSSNMYQQSAQIIVQKLRTHFTSSFQGVSFPEKISMHDVAILIDSTESMNGIIESYRAEAKRLARSVLQKGGRIALYEYRDLETFEPHELCDFTCTYDEFVQKIDQISCADGGDLPESSLSASLQVMNKLKWQFGATKSLVLLTDATYLDPDRDGTRLDKVVKRSLEIDPVNIYTLTPQKIKNDYLQLTRLTNGQSFSLEDEVQISTDTILNRPQISFPVAEYVAKVKQEIVFELNPITFNQAEVLEYQWDLDGDNIFETVTTGSKIAKTFTHPYEDYVQVKVVTDRYNATASAKVLIVGNVNELRFPYVTSLDSRPVNYSDVEINFRATAPQVLLVVDDVIMGSLSVKEGKNTFVLHDIKGITKISLVPYDDIQKGEPKSLVLQTKTPLVPNTGASGGRT